MFRTLISVLLSIALMSMSQSAASVRGASAAVNGMVICTGIGPVIVFLDADGEPTAAPHMCPDCALQMLDANFPADAVPKRLRRTGCSSRHANGVFLWYDAGTIHRVRAPPFSV